MKTIAVVIAVVVAGAGLGPARRASGERQKRQPPAVKRSGGPEAETAFPATAAGRQLEGYLRAARSGDRARLLAFVEGNFAPAFLQVVPLDQHLMAGLRMGREVAAWRLRQVVPTGEHEVAALFQDPLTEELFRLSLRVEETAPHRIARVGMRPADDPIPGEPRKKRTDAEIAKELEAFLDRLAKADRFSGAALVAHNGKPFFRKACGLASRAYQVPNRIDTKFNLGSMNKMFTAVAVAQLAEQGKLSFNDPVGKLLPDYPNRAVAEKVTVHHLLTHTSGMGSYFNEQFMQASRDRFRSVRDYFPLFVNEPLAFDPGARWDYSNSGFMLLGAIIEKVAGQDYFTYVREHVYTPAGMRDTDAYELDRDTPNLAMGYTRSGPDGEEGAGTLRNNLFLHVIKGGPAGGGYSTVEDLLRFDQALRAHRLLSPAMTETVLAGKIGTPGGGRYAYGFIDDRVNGSRVVGHSGGFPGISSQLDMYWDTGCTVAVLTNLDRAAPPVIGKARRLLAGQ
jgi:CubicO group peptidase (beta-lactamase class C family)